MIPDAAFFAMAALKQDFVQANDLPITHSLAKRHSCLTPAKNEGTGINNAGPIAGGMINQQIIFFYP